MFSTNGDLKKFLTENKIGIFIPTYNRVGKLVTPKNLPEGTFNLVCTKNEIHEYPCIFYSDEDGSSIMHKRNFIINYAIQNNLDYCIQIDDDGSFKVFEEVESSDKRKLIPMEEEHFIKALKEGMNWDYFSFGQDFFNFGDKGLKEDTTGTPFHMFKVSFLKENNIKCLSKVYEDVELICQIKQAGGRIVTDWNSVFKNNTITKKGGNSDSADFNQKDLFLKNINNLVERFPEYLKLIKTDKLFRGLDLGVSLRISYKSKGNKNGNNLEKIDSW